MVRPKVTTVSPTLHAALIRLLHSKHSWVNEQHGDALHRIMTKLNNSGDNVRVLVDNGGFRLSLLNNFAFDVYLTKKR